MTARDIIAELEAATEGSRELDGDIALALGLPQAYFAAFTSDIDGYPFAGFLDVDGPECFGAPIWGGGGRSWEAPEYTTSLDAATALVARLMPGWGYYLRSDKEGNGCGLVYPDAFRVTPCHCMGATPALAVLLALFRAMESAPPPIGGE